jgi:hypothetical protein
VATPGKYKAIAWVALDKTHTFGRVIEADLSLPTGTEN